ncbi:MAG: molybdopterin-binding oxidoreductase [Bacteroidetes bacterium]|nr:molybdopterin-binding oxidoreductase [Bacteroidota bacterium]
MSDLNNDQKKTVRRRTIISFAVFAACIVAVVIGWWKLYNQPQDSGVQRTLRKGLEVNEKVFEKVYDTTHLAKTYPKSAAVKEVRVNGDVGMGKDFNAKVWVLRVVRKPGDTLYVPLDSIRALPKTEIVFDFKCIEGWSQVTHWGGVRFSDFLAHYGLRDQASKKYAGLITPDKAYYVGIDMPSMINPQTLLCYEMNGKALPDDQGYPLRLIIPVKYGVKHLKRIGAIYFQDEKPADYWAEQGYDYYGGL